MGMMLALGQISVQLIILREQKNADQVELKR